MSTWCARTLLFFLPLAVLGGCGGDWTGEPSIPERTLHRAADGAYEYDPVDVTRDCASKEEAIALRYLNDVRRSAGGRPLTCLPVLQQTAADHAAYLQRNDPEGADLHHERPGLPGFTGAKIGDRARAHGVNRTHYWINEGVGGPKSPEALLERHLGSVFHRSHLLSPGTQFFALADRVILTLTHIEPGKRVATVYPPRGAEHVPLEFDSDRELPDPMPGRGVVGYPISVHIPRTFEANTGLEPRLNVRRFVVMHAGRTLRGKILDGGRDKRIFASDAYFVPDVPLDPDTTYQVEADMTYGDQRTQESWSFHTSAELN